MLVVIGNCFGYTGVRLGGKLLSQREPADDEGKKRRVMKRIQNWRKGKSQEACFGELTEGRKERVTRKAFR